MPVLGAACVGCSSAWYGKSEAAVRNARCLIDRSSYVVQHCVRKWMKYFVSYINKFEHMADFSHQGFNIRCDIGESVGLE